MKRKIRKIKWWLQRILEIGWVRVILGILFAIFVISYFLFQAGIIPTFIKNNEIGRWFIAIVMFAPAVIIFAPAVYLAIGLIISLTEGYKAKTSPMSKGIYICSLVSIIIGFYELYWFLFKGSELGLVLAVLSFVVSYICFYL